MSVRLSTNALLAIASTLGTLVLLVVGFEIYERFRYEAWLGDYERSAERRETLAVPSDNDRLIWEYRPNSVHERLGIRTNRFGYRGPDEVSRDKPEGVFRIAYIGDSATLGMFVAEEETFVRRFETLANGLGADRRVETLNFGIDGYNARQIGELLKARVVAFAPDKVIYVMHLNDFDFEGASGQKIRYFRPPASFLVDRMRRLYDETMLGKSDLDYHLFHFYRRKDVVLREIDAMNALAAKNNITFLVVVLPLFGRSFRDYKYRLVHDDLKRAFADRGIAFFDLLHPFGRQVTAPRFFAHDMWHPNARGHQFIATRLIGPVLADDFALARRFRPAGAWMRVPADRLRLDFSPLRGIAVSQAQRRDDSGLIVHEQVALDGAKGFVSAEFPRDALIDPVLARSLGRQETLLAKFHEASARLKFPVEIKRLVSLSGSRSGGGYVRYAIPRANLTCLFAYAGYALGSPGRFKVRGYDTLLLLNYCDKTDREKVIADFLHGLAASR